MITSISYRVPFIAFVINSPSTFTYYLDLSNFISQSGLPYFRVLTICLLLVYFVSAAGCHCFDLVSKSKLAQFFIRNKKKFENQTNEIALDCTFYQTPTRFLGHPTQQQFKNGSFTN